VKWRACGGRYAKHINGLNKNIKNVSPGVQAMPSAFQVKRLNSGNIWAVGMTDGTNIWATSLQVNAVGNIVTFKNAVCWEM